MLCFSLNIILFYIHICKYNWLLYLRGMCVGVCVCQLLGACLYQCKHDTENHSQKQQQQQYFFYIFSTRYNDDLNTYESMIKLFFVSVLDLCLYVCVCIYVLPKYEKFCALKTNQRIVIKRWSHCTKSHCTALPLQSDLCVCLGCKSLS